ncbi:Protein disulfide-isomerase [Amphibalanus amphitrite]|uniref:protein disulfide-isomerase n=1 Tax=Amphibalanus amphitrite TaxID=1232801 RepID=A0A6A4V5W3_AMPAM|nr:Protein disulfide-isomerase [Amphibalanus amphitrite]KAF0289126.1 Protein disulfide-isomerase [Amphibalanus amphitrite]
MARLVYLMVGVAVLTVALTHVRAAESAAAAGADTTPEGDHSDTNPANVEVEGEEEDTSSAEESEEHAATAPWKYDKNDILILNQHNFDRAIDEHEHLFVVFFTPTCSQCIQLHPHFVEAWKSLRERADGLQFAKIDCTNETALLLHYGITQYPTLTFFKSQKEKMYDGGYRSVDIEAWVEKRMGAPALPIEAVQTLEEARAENDVIAVGFFRDPDSVSAIIYLRVADAVHDYPFFIVRDQELFEHYDLTDDTVVVFKKFDDGRVDFPAGDYVADDLMEFLRLETFPLVSELTMENVWRVTEEANVVKSHFLVFRNASDPVTPAGITDMLLPAAKKHKGQILFLMIDMADRRMFHMEEFFGVRRDRVPAMRIFRYEGPTFKFRPAEDGAISEELVLQFCDQFVTGKLSAFQLSQPLPEDWDAAPVKVLTAENYQEVVLNAERAVFVMLYAPWCPHCQLTTPIFEQLAAMYEPYADAILFGKMDATANEVEDLEFASYPTFYLYTTGGQRQQFNGSRTIDEMVSFLNEHSGVQLDVDLPESGGHTEPDGDASETCSAGGGDCSEEMASKDTPPAGSAEGKGAELTNDTPDGSPQQAAAKDEL